MYIDVARNTKVSRSILLYEHKWEGKRIKFVSCIS